MSRSTSIRSCTGYPALVLALASCQASAPELLEQHRFQEAYDLLLAAQAANPADWEATQLLCRALGGWFEFSADGRPVRVRGLDKPIEAYRKLYVEPRRDGRHPRPDVEKYSLEWYRFVWQCFWYARCAGEVDASFQPVAAAFYRMARSTDEFAHLRAKGPEGAELYRYFRANR